MLKNVYQKFLEKIDRVVLSVPQVIRRCWLRLIDHQRKLGLDECGNSPNLLPHGHSSKRIPGYHLMFRLMRGSPLVEWSTDVPPIKATLFRSGLIVDWVLRSLVNLVLLLPRNELLLHVGLKGGRLLRSSEYLVFLSFFFSMVRPFVVDGAISNSVESSNTVDVIACERAWR
jgi:hypothetical protein